ncbi:MAG: hypothetical protein Q9M22_07325 [Mariprofundaceae bacterium]|nr:hypothetical protein [Mariprofundaceae bacterium]
MAGFFERLFGNNEPVRPRRFNHPRDLRAGDIIKMNFLKQSELSGKTFEVSQINTYIYGNLCYPELVLKDRDNSIIFLMVEEEDGEEYLAFSKKVAKADIRTLLLQTQLDAILEQGAGTKVILEQILPGFEGWLAKKYTETDDHVKGMFLKGDARYLSDEEVKRTEPFSSHTLVDKSDKYALEVEVYETGELELSVTVYHDIDEINEMWPGPTDT